MIAKKWWQGGVGIVGKRRGGTKRPDRQAVEKEVEEEEVKDNDDTQDEVVGAEIKDGVDTSQSSSSSLSLLFPNSRRKTLSTRMTPELILDQVTTITTRNPSWQAAILAGTSEPNWWKSNISNEIDKNEEAKTASIDSINSTNCSAVSFHNWGCVLWEQGRAAWRYRDPSPERVLIMSSSSSSSLDTVQGRRQRRRGKFLVGNNHAMITKEEDDGSKITGTITSENRKPLRDVIAFYCELWGCNTITGDDDW